MSTKTNFGDVDVAAGSITAEEIGSGAAPDGQVLTADGVGGAAWAAAAGPGYLEYVVLLNQDGNPTAPVATVLKNTLGGTVVWTRNVTGEYYGTLVGAFTSGKTTLFAGSESFGSGNNGPLPLMAHAPPNAIAVSTIDGDDRLAGCPIEIRVYP